MSKGLRLTAVYVLYIGLVLVIILALVSWFRQGTQSVSIRKSTDLDSAKKYIIITLDDGWGSQYEAYQKLKPLKGTLYICSGLIGQQDRLTLDNLQEMYKDGWDICNHTVNHVNLTEVTPAKAAAEISGCSQWLAGHGFTRSLGYKHFAYPEGGYNEDIINILRSQKVLTARTTNSGNSTADPLQLGRSSLWGMTAENIRQLIHSEQKLIILSLHRIVPDDTAELKEIDLKSSYLEAIIKAITESQREAITLTEWYDRKS